MDRLTEAAATYKSLITQMVSQPERLQMDVIDDCEGKVTFRIKAAEPDLGILIGMQGRTARALRIILGSIAVRVDRKITLDITVSE